MSHFWQNHSWNHSLFECPDPIWLPATNIWTLIVFPVSNCRHCMEVCLALPAITKSAWLVEICFSTSRIGVTSEISSTTSCPAASTPKILNFETIEQGSPKIHTEKTSEWFMMFPNQAKIHGFVWKLDILTMVDHHVFQEHGNLLGLPPFLDKPTARMYSNHHEPSHWQMYKRWLVGYYNVSKQPWNIMNILELLKDSPIKPLNIIKHH